MPVARTTDVMETVHKDNIFHLRICQVEIPHFLKKKKKKARSVTEAAVKSFSGAGISGRDIAHGTRYV